jgi:hypothetical protein
MLSVPATLGGIVIVVVELLIVHSLHLLLKRRSVTYSRFCTSIKSWFLKLVRLAPKSMERLRHVVAVGRMNTKKPKVYTSAICRQLWK